jgi:Tol biopolymer transport system component
MKIKILLCTTCLLCSLVINAIAQLPDTDIYVADISKVDGQWTFGEAENITHRIGYDNQPGFSPDNERLLYVRVADSLQSDVYEYTFSSKSTERVTDTDESEYSPTYTPDGSQISVVRVDRDSAQRFYLLNSVSPAEVELVTGSDSIGYYCRLNDTLLAMFLVGENFSLQLLNLNTHSKTFIAYNIGRCLKLSADKQSLMFVDKSDSSNWMITSLLIRNLKMKPLIKVIPGNEDFSALPDGSLLMGSEGKLYIWRENSKNGWKLVKDYEKSIGPFYRITVNDNGTKIAFVAYAGKKP